MPFAVTVDQYEAAVKEFRPRYANGTLPEKMAIERWQKQEETTAEVSAEESVMNLFGKENVEVIDEGE